MKNYKIGNVVKIAIGHLIWEGDKVYDIATERIGKLAVIDEITLNQGKPKYSIILYDQSNSIAWYDHQHLHLVRETDNESLTIITDYKLKIK